MKALEMWHSPAYRGDTWMHSVAVMPLEDFSSDSAQDAFAAGMTAALIADLGRIHSLRVIARQSVMPFKGTLRSSSEIGRALHVDGLVEGTIQQTADTFRIDLQLIEASS